MSESNRETERVAWFIHEILRKLPRDAVETALEDAVGRQLAPQANDLSGDSYAVRLARHLLEASA